MEQPQSHKGSTTKHKYIYRPHPTCPRCKKKGFQHTHTHTLVEICLKSLLKCCDIY